MTESRIAKFTRIGSELAAAIDEMRDDARPVATEEETKAEALTTFLEGVLESDDCGWHLPADWDPVDLADAIVHAPASSPVGSAPTETGTTVTIPKPYMLYLGPNDTVALTYRKAAEDLERGYDIGGSNRRDSIARVLHDIADALFVTVKEGGA
ncbi:hypothetical protein [Rhodococcus sp. no. 34]